MKKIAIFAQLILLSFFISAGCASAALRPLWNAAGPPDKTIVISDIHLGISDDFAEDVANRPLLVEFLKRLEKTADVKELVIAGDFLDEWYLPMSYPAYTDSSEFYRAVIKNNKVVIDELKNVMSRGIKLVYVPGNHDMTLGLDVLAEALPGIILACDAPGLGAYHTGCEGDAVIEHGHRYDVFSAPDSFSNKELCRNGSTILPPGYFYARYAASWIAEGKPKAAKNYPKITGSDIPKKTDTDQYDAYLYHVMLSSEFSRMTPKEDWREKTFDVRIDGFSDSYSVEDMFPVLRGGVISAPVLYKNFQRTWDERQKQNLVAVKVSFSDSVMGATGHKFCEQQAKAQYLENKNRKINAVIFGHTHIPQYMKLENGKVYINTGTWIDHNASCREGTSRTFAVIPRSDVKSARLYQYTKDGRAADISDSMVR